MYMQIAAQLAIEQTHDGAVPIWELEPSWIPDMCAHALTTSQIQLQIESDQADGNEVAGKSPAPLVILHRYWLAGPAAAHEDRATACLHCRAIYHSND